MRSINSFPVSLIAISAIACGIPVVFQSYELLLCIGLIPLLFVLKGLSANQSFAAGLLFGLIFTSIISYWVTDFLENFNSLSTIESLFIATTFWLYSALPYAFTCFLFRYLSEKTPRIEVFIFPVVLISINSLYPHLFPPHFSLGLVNTPYLLQGIDITGVYGAEFILLLTNASLYKLIFSKSDYQSIGVPIASICILIWITYCHVNFNFWSKHTESGKVTKVGLVQPNDPLASEQNVSEDVYSWAYPKEMTYTQLLAKKGAELIIWPETKGLSYFSKNYVAFAFQQQTKHLGIDLLFHDMQDHTAKDDKKEFSSAVLLTKNGDISIYRKSKLIPIAEYLPEFFNYNWSKKLLVNTFGDFIAEQLPGKRSQVLEAEKLTLIPLICYEALFPLDIDYQLLKKQSNLLITVLSNDIWFGQSRASYQHSAYTVLRSIESRLPVIHATNNGPSAVISPSGKKLIKTESNKEETLLFDQNSSSQYKPTIFIKVPFAFLILNYFILACIFALAIFGKQTKPHNQAHQK